MQIYNSLSREVEEFKPNESGKVSLYACGPTVYDFQHIGNLRTSTLMDVLKRSLKYIGYNVESVMNVTDVEDKIERRAKENNMTVDELTDKYEQFYMQHLAALNISADQYPHASENIAEDIALIEVLLGKGFAYQIESGIYFDISKDPEYGKLGNTFKSDRGESRIGLVEGKRNQADFALWKFPENGEDRQKLWDSPWGKGFPGWHIECSAMSMKYLSPAFDHGHLHPEDFETIDIHVGGEDLKEVHHENEIAQSESVTGKQFVKYWVHGAMLNVESDKMSKSLNNFYTLEQITEKGFKPLALRYFFYTAHYRKILNFTWDALQAAETAYDKLLSRVSELAKVTAADESSLLPAPDSQWQEQFKYALEDDLNMPQAMAVVWEMLRSEKSDDVKLATLLDFDQVLGLNLESAATNPQVEPISPEVQALVDERAQARSEKDWAKADQLRDELREKFGLEVLDTANGQEVVSSRIVDSLRK